MSWRAQNRSQDAKKSNCPWHAVRLLSNEYRRYAVSSETSRAPRKQVASCAPMPAPGGRAQKNAVRKKAY
jgi:hypothetical protein